MPDTFIETSKMIANDFLQSIVFIDDKAYCSPEERGNHDFDAYLVSRAFAQKKKLCAVYKPKTLNDIELLIPLAKKADITVLDWQINLDEEPVPDGQEEVDVEAIDPRGPHTLRLIREILLDPTSGEGNLKLIMVYTGEIALQDIRDDIYNALSALGILNLVRDFCEVSTDNIKILIVSKPDNEIDNNGNLQSKFIHNSELNSRVKRYNELPDFILDEFTKMTTGLLANFVLKSLTILRNNTFRFVKLYNKNLDVAFLTHRLLLPNQDDSKEQLIQVFADSVEALLNYNQADDTLSANVIIEWISDTQNFSKVVPIAGKNITLNNAFVRTWIEQNFTHAVSDQWAQLNYGVISDDNIKSINKKKEELLKSSSVLKDDNNQNDINFSVLTHHKSIFKPKHILPKLTLGSIVKGLKSGYWVCIQQRCDSVRIEDERRFLFLPLKEIQEDTKDKFHFITADGIRLQLSKRSFNLRTIKFRDTTGEGVIKAKVNENKLIFEPVYKQGHNDYNADKDEVYEWILDLKDLHAQRIAHDFANELSRVGLDESEWLRRRS